ncbi:MAG: SufS family cysteine desulfurase [Phycisphaeraceae bacterium]
MTTTSDTATSAYDVERVREQFPILSRQVHGKPLVYLDNAATTQKPRQVIDAVADYYRQTNANVHRGVHALSGEATTVYENARDRVAQFLGSPSREQIVFTRGTTEAINLVAQSWARRVLGEGDEILLSQMEHHSNIVPWQLVAEQTGAVVKVIPINDRGELDMAAFEERLSERTRIVGVVHVSNALGTVNPVETIIEKTHAAGAKVLVDAAQSVPHLGVDVQAMDCDFLAMSGHKVFGPTGIGALYAKKELLDAMPPYQGGGDMIKDVTFEKTVYAEPPYRFEAGTPNVAGAIGLAAALEWVDAVGLDAIAAHERQVLDYATQVLSGVKGLRIIGTAEHKAAVVSFVLEFAHPLDAGTILDRLGVAVRTGHHCAQPVMDRFEVSATVRASLGPYNTRAEIDTLAAGLEKVRQFV